MSLQFIWTTKHIKYLSLIHIYIFYDSKYGRKIDVYKRQAHNFTLSKPNELKLSSPLENNVIYMSAKFQPCHYTKNIFYESKYGRKI